MGCVVVQLLIIIIYNVINSALINLKDSKNLVITYLPTDLMVADILNKPLQGAKLMLSESKYTEIRTDKSNYYSIYIQTQPKAKETANLQLGYFPWV